MNAPPLKYFMIAVFVSLLFTQGCSTYAPVSASQCVGVVKHTKKILGLMAPKHKKMMVDCKKATDDVRGCIMAATTKIQIAQCV